MVIRQINGMAMNGLRIVDLIQSLGPTIRQIMPMKKPRKQIQNMAANPKLSAFSMKFKTFLLAAIAVILSTVQVFAQATILPPGETCFSALAPTSGGPGNTGTGFIGLLGTITGGSGYTNGTYGGVSLTGGSGSNATANITVSGGQVTAVAILNPGSAYVVGDVLSATAASIGGTGSGFSVSVSSLSINYSLAGGSVAFYIPNTLTIKQTWQDAGQTILNSNPVPLDANGCAVIYGSGIYRSILQDSQGNTIWDKLTASTGGGSIFWAGNASGTPNAISITDASFTATDGQNIQFRALSENTGPATISVSGGGAISVVVDTPTGPAALSGGEIGPSNLPIVSYDATNFEFHLVNPSQSTSTTPTGSTSLPTPQGYLNLIGQASGNIVQTGDVLSASTVYYSPFVGNLVPIWNGTSFKTLAISELTTTLTSAGSPANSIQDECVFSNNGVATLVTGPSWTTATAGAGSRGTGAGSAQLIRVQGIWVNAVSIVGYNGISSFTIPANQCTYVGSIYLDATAGQVSAYRTFGQNRKFGVWNAYNRQPIIVQVGDSTASWTYSTATVRASNNAPASYTATEFNTGSGTTCNGGAVFEGLAEEEANIGFVQTVNLSVVNNQVVASIGIGINSTTAASGKGGQYSTVSTLTNSGFSGDVVAKYTLVPTLGIMNFIALESANNAVVFNGTNHNMILTAEYRG
jgi:hypothetical protein